MGIFARIRRLLHANMHDLLDKAEDPARTLNYLVLEMQEGIEQAREQVAAAMAAERRLALQGAESAQAAAQWTERARRALAHGEELLAREAVRRKVAAQEMAEYYGRASEQQAAAVAELRETLHCMELRLSEARARRAKLLAQLELAEAQKLVVRTRQQAIGEEAFATFDRLALRVVTEQHTAAALTELNGSQAEDAFLIADETSAIEAEMMQLQRELPGGAEDTPALEQQGERS